jgi:hypothetical protein
LDPKDKVRPEKGDPMACLIARELIPVEELPARNLPPVVGCDCPAVLPIWLTRAEAEALITLCAGSPQASQVAEDELFVKLGDLYRAFHR